MQHIPLVATLLSLSATCVQAADLTTAIGTGHAADSPEAARPFMRPAVGVPAAPHWSALIGTGHVAYREPTFHSAHASQPGKAVPHWTSLIGTGHAMDSRHTPAS